MDDLISRQDALDTLRQCHKHHIVLSYSDLIEIEEAEARIRRVPSAQPETAKRIVGKSRNGMTLWYQCDMCNEPVDAQDSFCRGCGRRLTDG